MDACRPRVDPVRPACSASDACPDVHLRAQRPGFPRSADLRNDSVAPLRMFTFDWGSATTPAPMSDQRRPATYDNADLRQQLTFGQPPVRPNLNVHLGNIERHPPARPHAHTCERGSRTGALDTATDEAPSSLSRHKRPGTRPQDEKQLPESNPVTPAARLHQIGHALAARATGSPRDKLGACQRAGPSGGSVARGLHQLPAPTACLLRTRDIGPATG